MSSSGKVLFCVSLLVALAFACHLAAKRVDYTPPRADAEERNAGAVDEATSAIHGRVVARMEAAEAVVCGRLPLLQAAALFRSLDRASPHFRWEDFRLQTPGTTDDERHCREVIAMTAQVLHDKPARAAAVQQKLEEELRQHLRRGPLHLPAPQAAAE